ncbi:FxsA family protein [Plantactinospora siamensis]|uniref:FxsA family protein n=1 Tax=Plantactinospora siamensis TaxID=555372 RepID=A0ABV6P0F3_9ACTN
MPRWLRYLPLALLVAAVVEIAVFVLLGHLIGYAPTLLLALLASAAGLFLVRREGMRAWRSFRAAAAAGQPPGRQVTDGLIGLLGALLLAVPGLVSGLLGVLLLVPPVRRVARAAVERATERRVSSMLAGEMFGPRRVRVRRGAPTDPAASGDPGAADPIRPPAGAVRPTVSPAPPGAGDIVEGEIVDR